MKGLLLSSEFKGNENYDSYCQVTDCYILGNDFHYYILTSAIHYECVGNSRFDQFPFED
jgi:hypothetical protein